MYAVVRLIVQIGLIGAILVALVFSAGSPTQLHAPTVGPAPQATTTLQLPLLLPQQHDYLEVLAGCDSNYIGECVVARTTPDHAAPIAAPLRTGMVLRVAETIEGDDGVWYKIGFDTWIRYPGRISSEWYVAATSSVRISKETGEENLLADSVASSTKRILVDRSDQTLVAYDGDVVFMETSVSTGLALTPTPRGTFTVYRKTPSRYMQGPLLGISDQYYDLPGVPWNLYFTLQGGVVHGAYWHDNFGKPWSHGCVNLALEDARLLYHWADIGTTVIIQD